MGSLGLHGRVWGRSSAWLKAISEGLNRARLYAHAGARVDLLRQRVLRATGVMEPPCGAGGFAVMIAFR